MKSRSHDPHLRNLPLLPCRHPSSRQHDLGRVPVATAGDREEAESVVRAVCEEGVSDRLTTLEAWAAARYGDHAPSIHTLRRWVREAKIGVI